MPHGSGTCMTEFFSGDNYVLSTFWYYFWRILVAPGELAE
jgi:hypothetical protein